MGFLKSLFESVQNARLNEFKEDLFNMDTPQNVDPHGFVSQEELRELYETRDPATGERYNIPYLTSEDPAFFFKYASYMRILKRNPKTFERILGWE